jgi:hypothetical protein
MAAELDIEGDRRARDLPRVAVAQPLVRALDLPAVADLLVEDAELVTDAVADRRDLQRRERFHVAGREPTEPAVAEARLPLVVDQPVEIEPEALHRPAHFAPDAEVEQVRAEVRPEQELGREVAHGARRESGQACSRSRR